QEFRRAPAVVAQVQPAIEACVAATPALGNQRPERFRYLQPAQIFLVLDRTADQFEAHRLDLAGGPLNPPLDFVERERVIGPLVPIALAVDGVKREACAFGGGTPVVAFGAGDALHELSRRKSRRHGRTSRSRRVARCASRNRKCPRMNGSRTNRSSSSCCATSCRRSRHRNCYGCWTKSCAMNTRYYLAEAMA